MPYRGRATRLELYGCLLGVVIAIELVCERLAVDRAIIDETLRRGHKPMMIQANHQEVQVNFEHPVDKLVREIEEKRKLINGKETTIKPDTNNYGNDHNYNRQRVPADSDAMDGTRK